MNKFFEFENLLKETKDNKKYFLSMIKNCDKTIEEIEDLCDHTYINGNSAITRENDRGHGHIIYTCNICGRYGNKDWSEKTSK
jgi:hypothetical protein